LKLTVNKILTRAMFISMAALFLLTDGAVRAPSPPRLSPQATAQATATILEARMISFADARPPSRSPTTGELRRLVEFE
jgi:hypothetical protein